MATSPTCIIAYASDDERFAALGRAAVDTARSAQARLIFYDIDAAGMFAAPLPTQWSGDGAADQFGDRLSPDDLERAGRHGLAQQVTMARQAGVDAYGWLPQQKGSGALAEYAEKQGAELIMLPKEMDDPGLLDRMRGATIEKAEKQTHIPVALVDDEGHVDYPAHDAAPHDGESE
ncbi:MAG: hypothetical protein ACR2HN_08665 [Tepidiformaceae bacterium]